LNNVVIENSIESKKLGNWDAHFMLLESPWWKEFYGGGIGIYRSKGEESIEFWTTFVTKNSIKH
jgi:hypothetical protein